MSSAIQTPRTPRAPRRWRDIAFLGGLLLLMLFGLFGLAAATGWEETLTQLRKLNTADYAVLLGLSLINYFFRAARWHLFARALGLATVFLQNLRHFLGGFAMSVTPGRVGELIRMRWIGRETGWSFEQTAPLVLVDRASDLAAMAIILGLAVTQAMGGVGMALPVALLALLAAYVVTRPRLLARIVTYFYRITGLWPRLFVRARRAALSLRAFTHIRLLIPALGLGFFGWLAEGYAFWLLLGWMGADVGFWTAVGIFVFATLAGGLTGAPGGVGGAEAAMVALLALEGVPLETSLPATAIIRVTTLWFAIGIGLMVFPFAERQSMKARDALDH